MKVSKLDQINNTLELNKKSLQNNTKVNTEFISLIENALPKLIDAKIKKAAAFNLEAWLQIRIYSIQI